MKANRQLAVGLDLGSTATRALICVLDGDHLIYAGHGSARSHGWIKGKLADEAALGGTILQAVGAAEKVARMQVDAATVGIGGPAIHGANTRGLYEFGRPREIDYAELAYAVERASNVQLEDDRCVLHVFPQDFTVDGRSGYRKPRKAVCSRLEANCHIVTASLQQHQVLVSAVHQAHLAVEETVFEPVAAAYAAILPEDRARGVALIDLGFDSTGLAIYDGESLVRAASLPVWADHLTRDVAWLFKVNYEDAECLKRQYGCAVLGLTADNSLIEVPSPEGRAPREARRRELNEILEARTEELFGFVRPELERLGMEQSLLEGVVLTGGGALLNGMCDMAERVLNCQARNGLAIGIGDLPEELETPEWTTAAGLAMFSARLKLHRSPKRPAPGLMGLVMR